MHPTYLFEIDFYLYSTVIFVSNINVKVQRFTFIYYTKKDRL